MRSARNELATTLDRDSDLESYVAQFELAFSQTGSSLDDSFLPPSNHPQRLEISVELLRVDLELCRERGDDKSLEAYRSIVPEVFAAPTHLAALAFEEYRLRRDAGERVSWEEYISRFDLPADTWPNSVTPLVQDGEVARFPSVGEYFAGLRLESLLGSGACSRVYLTRQPEFGDRMVALKITSQQTIEPERLGRLQHTNIVPIYSAHRDQGLLAICMPFLGRMTLADLRTPLPWREAATCVAQLAEGLAHAHRRDVVHSDIKPANVLLGDDGIPRLLDFHLATRTDEANEGRFIVGGTIPYMAPEHVEAVLTGSAPSPQSDIFALGAILFQLLTGKLPFASRRGNFAEIAPQLIADRTAASISPRSVNPSVPRGVDAIVRKCLSGRLADRYESAGQVAEDLRCELEDRPLVHVREPWSLARAAKWRRRNKTLLSQVGLAAACLAAVAIGAIYWNRSQNLAATTALHRFEESALEARAMLCIPDAAADLNARGRQVAASALTEFGGSNDRLLERLNAEDRQRVVAGVGELRALIDNADLRARSPAERQQRVSTFASPEPITLVTAGLMSEQKYSQAEAILQEAVGRRGGDPVLWIQLGVAQMASGKTASALESFTAAIAIQPESAVAWRYRGYASLEAGKAAEALADFDRVAALDPASCSLELNRALALLQLEHLSEAEEAATRALETGSEGPRAWLLRAKIRERQGNRAGAEADRQMATRKKPVEADDWAALAIACQRDNPQQALDFIEQGLEQHPNSLVLLRNHIHLLGDVVNKPQLALASAERIIEIRPGDVQARLSRAVILGRAGDCARALEVCRELASQSLRPVDRLQLACVFALCAKSDATAADSSIQQLRLALAEQPSLAIRAVQDPDLSAIKKDLRFRQLIGSAASLLRPAPVSQTTQVGEYDAKSAE